MSVDPRIKQIKIKAGVVKRLAKEKGCYANEANAQRSKVAQMKADGRDEHEIKKQEEVLQESLRMIPDCLRRLHAANEDLRRAIDSEKDLSESEDYKLANEILIDGERAASETH